MMSLKNLLFSLAVTLVFIGVVLQSASELVNGPLYWMFATNFVIICCFNIIVVLAIDWYLGKRKEKRNI